MVNLPVIVIFLTMLACLFVSSGDLTWMAAWAYLAITFAALLLTEHMLRIYRPDLRKERSGRSDHTIPWDRVLAPLSSAVLPSLVLVVAGVERRFQEEALATSAFQVGAFAIICTGYGLVLWSMLSNPFFTATVRIQTEWGHRVISVGPYRIIRHPGYAGVIVCNLAVPAALGTAWAWLPAIAAIAAILVRTFLEDRTLKAELPGYLAYTADVKARILPLVW